jgi:hypothetical protein
LAGVAARATDMPNAPSGSNAERALSVRDVAIRQPWFHPIPPTIGGERGQSPVPYCFFRPITRRRERSRCQPARLCFAAERDDARLEPGIDLPFMFPQKTPPAITGWDA